MGVKVRRGWWVVSLLSLTSFAATSGDLRLVEAVKSQDNAAVRSLLKQHINVNTPSADGATAVAWAAHQDNLELAELLIHAGANVNAANIDGVTPLSLACTDASSAMVEELLKAGANPNAALPSGETPLMTAAHAGKVEAVKSLLAHRADVNAKETEQGQTALMWALAENHMDVARALIEHGADIHAHSKDGFTPLLFAAQQGSMDAVQTLLAAEADVNESTPQDGSVLAVATYSGHEALALFLLDKGADPNVADRYGLTPLHLATLKGLATAGGVSYLAVTHYMFRPDMPELVKALLAHGANPNARIVKVPPLPSAGRKTLFSLIGATPFLLAAAASDADLMRILAAAGADPQLTTKEGATPLMMAAGLARAMNLAPVPRSEEDTKASLEAVKAAVELGNDVNATTVVGEAAIFGAAYLGGTESIEYMAAHGAKVDVENMWGQTPLSISEMRWGPEIPRLTDDTLRPRHVYQSTVDALVKLGATPLTSTSRTPFIPSKSSGPETMTAAPGGKE